MSLVRDLIDNSLSVFKGRYLYWLPEAREAREAREVSILGDSLPQGSFARVRKSILAW
jgi:hypothetical protein